MILSDSLVNKMKMGRCVLFLGAGASISSGGPTGKELAEYLRDEVVLSQDGYDDDLVIYTEMLFGQKKASRKQIELGIKKRLESLKPSGKYRGLACVPWKTIYTTNYDTLIEDAYKSQNLFRLVKINQYNQYDHLGSNEISLHKIHGCVTEIYDPEKPLVISFTDLRENKKRKKELMFRLMNDLVDTVLFVGYSFKDQIITDLLDELSETSLWGSISDKYAVITKTDSKDVFKFSAYGVTAIETTFDNFFDEVGKIIENDYQAKLRALRKSLIINVGSKMRKFEPMTKVLIDTYFEYYDVKKGEYPSDPQYFYRGGKPQWGEIMKNLDVPRSVLLTDNRNNNIKNRSISLLDILDLFESVVYSEKPRFTRILLSGPAAVGKTTLIYRIALELMLRGVLTLIYKDVGDIRQGLLAEIYKCNENKPYVIIVDSAASNSMQINKIYSEIAEKGLNIIILLSTRLSDWNIFLDGPIKRRLNHFDIALQLEDRLDLHQSELLADKLIQFNVVQCNVEHSKQDIIYLLKNTNHLMVSLIEVVANTTFDEAISSEYDLLKDIGKNTYGLVSLVSQFGLSLKWELLQRTLNRLLNISWDEFINKIVYSEGKDIIREEGKSPNYYYTCRHSYIAEQVVIMHYKGNKKNEISALKSIIESVNSGTSEEIFIGRLLNIIIRSQDKLDYSSRDIVDLLDAAIIAFADKSFILHIKGQYLLDNAQPERALICFRKNLDNKFGRNEMYSRHSAGMAHFAIANGEPLGSGRRQLAIKAAKDELYTGFKKYKDNPFFQKSLLQVLTTKVSDETITSDDLKIAEAVIEVSRHSMELEADELKECEQLFSIIKDSLERSNN